LYVADQLFSTLDTYVRKVELSDGHDVLVSDTVGFIRDLPPALIAAFRTTLEEISVSSLILLVLDGSMPDVMETLDVVEETLSDIGAGAIPRLIVLNKIDKIDLSLIPFLQTRLQGRSKAKVLPICALSGVGVTELLQEVEYQLFNKMAK
jgi:GTP-binding protein HflX